MLNDINNKEALIELLHSFECSYHALTYYTLTAHTTTPRSTCKISMHHNGASYPGIRCYLDSLPTRQQ